MNSHGLRIQNLHLVLFCSCYIMYSIILKKIAEVHQSYESETVREYPSFMASMS